MNVRSLSSLAWIGLASMVAACAPTDDVENARPVSWWEGEGLSILDASKDPDGARFELSIGDLEVGTTAGGVLRVRNTGDGTLQIQVRNLPEAVSVRVPGPIERNGNAEVAVSLTPQVPGTLRYLIDLDTNDPLFTNVRFRVVALAVTSSDPDDPDDPIEDPDDPVDPDDPTDPGTEDPDEPEEPGDDDPVDPGDDPTIPEPACWEASDAFVAARKIDVLWVMDNSDAIPQHYLKDLLSSFLSAANHVDYQIGVTSTGLYPSGSSCPGGANGGENGRLFPVDGSSPRIITSTMPAAQQDAAWRVNAMVGDCHSDEQPYEAAHRALSPPLVDHADDPRTDTANDGNLGFLRSDADLAIVFATDERDHANDIPGNTWTPADYVAFFQSLKPGAQEKVKLHAITGPRSGSPYTGAAEFGDRLLDGVDATGGSWFELANYTPAQWATRVDGLSPGVFGHLGLTFRLSAPPEDRNGDGIVDESDIDVQLDGHPEAAVQGGMRVWSFDDSANAVRFDPAFRPAPGAQVTVEFQVPCTPTESP